MKTNRKILFVLIVCLTTSISCTPMMYDDDLVGNVIDGETSDPIQSAVVLGKWNKWNLTPAGEITSYYDARETVTDEKGNFKLEGKGLRVLTNISHMTAYIIKDGYKWKATSYKRLTQNNGLVKLYKISKKQLVNYSGPSVYSIIPHDEMYKIKLFIKEDDLLLNRANDAARELRETGEID